MAFCNSSSIHPTSFAVHNAQSLLKVFFYILVAEDYGGPRKEFFRLVLAQIKETFFDKGLRKMLREKYVAVGIVNFGN
jgi:hypothetical protein